MPLRIEEAKNYEEGTVGKYYGINLYLLKNEVLIETIFTELLADKNVWFLVKKSNFYTFIHYIINNT